ncbi:MAG: Hpt domain-containing protein, partial [Hoeflea sp.]|nr:Hpt domain-containing protein [Hoeflea sp.]
MDMNEIKEIFFQECEEQLAELESGLLRINDGDSDPETVNAVFRAVHSIKGGAGAFGLDDLVSFAHVFETTLDCVRSNKLQTSSELLKVMLKSADVLADLTAASRDGGSVDKSRTSDLVKELEAFAKGTPLPVAAPVAEPVRQEAPVAVAAPAAPEPTDDAGFQPVPFSFDDFGDEADEATPAEAEGGGRSVFTVRFKPRSDLYAKGNEAVLLMRDLAKVGDLQVICEIDALPPIDQLDPEGAYFSWLIRVETDKDEDAIRHVFEFAEWDCLFEVKPGADEALFSVHTDSGEDLPMAPVPFDLSMLDEEPAAAAPVADAPAPAVVAAVSVEEAPLAPPSLPRAEKAIAAEAEKKEAAVAGVPAAPQTIRVDLDRVDRLINLVGELVINQAMLAHSVVENESGGSSAINLGLEELQQLTREIQDSVMAIRAQPVKPV